MCSVAALVASGCSMSIPLPGFAADPVVTGSTEKSDALLFKALDQEDWRRAKAALDVALDPQGNGASVNWDNPASGARGSFEPTAAPIAGAGGVCRGFVAHMRPQAGTDRDVRGSACRDADGAWAVRQAAEIKKS